MHDVCAGAGVADLDAVAVQTVIAGDDVAIVRAGAADEIARSAELDLDAVAGVSLGHEAGPVRADVGCRGSGFRSPLRLRS